MSEDIATPDWSELLALLACSMPDANVNMIEFQVHSETAWAIEVRHKARLFEALPALLAKWTVIVFEVRPGALSVAIVKMDRQVIEQREFDSSNGMEVAEFVKSHPFVNSKWSFCHGISETAQSSEAHLIDHLGGKAIRRSVNCELLVAEEEHENASNECKFCLAEENVAKVEKKEPKYPTPVPTQLQQRTQPAATEQKVTMAAAAEAPKKTYAQLIAEALSRAQDRTMPIHKIHEYIYTNYPYFKPGEKGWRDCVSSCLMNNSFFQTLPDAPNLWRLVDAKRQSPTPKVIYKKSTPQATPRDELESFEAMQQPAKAIKMHLHQKMPAAAKAAATRDNPSDPTVKPKRTYSQLISEALLNSQSRMLPLYDIYLYISRNYPFYGMEAKGSKAWQNAIRHNLTLNPNFEKVARPSPRGRGNFWKLSDDADLRDGRGRGKNRNYIDASRFRDYDEYRNSILEAAAASSAGEASIGHAQEEEEEDEDEEMYLDAEQPQLEVVIKEEVTAESSGGE